MRSNKLESGFQDRLIQDLEKEYPDAMIFKMDQLQGIPDLLILNGDRWATLECKKSEDADHQPNQDYYVDKMNRMSFSSFIFPENKEEVLNELRKAFSA